MDNFFQLSLDLQLALGAGYLGYLAAYTGVRAHHQQIDIAFLTVAFGLIATVTSSYIPPDCELLRILAACLLSVIAGLVWRKWVKGWVRKLLKLGGFAYTDDDPSVLTTIAADTLHNVSQVKLVKTDGSELVCNDTAMFADAAIAPFIYGADGSVAMYVTHSYRRAANGEMLESVRTKTRNKDWGDNMTIVPASSVRQLELRFQRKAQSSRAGGGLGGVSAGAEGE